MRVAYTLPLKAHHWKIAGPWYATNRLQYEVLTRLLLFHEQLWFPSLAEMSMNGQLPKAAVHLPHSAKSEMRQAIGNRTGALNKWRAL